MNVAYASDNNFAQIMGISIISLFENNTDIENMTVYIIDDKIKKENKNKLLLISEKYRRKIVFLPIPDFEKLEEIKIQTNARWSRSAFSRLFLEKIIPKDVKKILYLDCDTIVNGSLKSLYDTELGDYYCAGVSDCISNAHKKNVGLSSSDYYINSGVMLISLDNWRKKQLYKTFSEFIRKLGGKIPYVDQGVINGTISEKIMPIALKYNCFSALFDFTYPELIKYRKPHSFYGEEEYIFAKENPVIIHFTSSYFSTRPWIEGCRHPFVKKWLKYKAASPWADEPLRKDNKTMFKKIALKIYNMLPRKIAVEVAGIIHSYIVPSARSK